MCTIIGLSLTIGMLVEELFSTFKSYIILMLSSPIVIWLFPVFGKLLLAMANPFFQLLLFQSFALLTIF